MAAELERVFGSSSEMVAHPSASGRNGPAGALERMTETRHLARLRQAQRGAEVQAVRQAQALIVETARMEALARASTEAKYRLHRAQTESHLLAGEDPVLRAQFAAIDDTLAVTYKMSLLHWKR